MNMVCLFIHLDLCFLSSAFCDFQHINPEHVLLDLYLSGLQGINKNVISGQLFKAKRYFIYIKI